MRNSLKIGIAVIIIVLAIAAAPVIISMFTYPDFGPMQPNYPQDRVAVISVNSDSNNATIIAQCVSNPNVNVTQVIVKDNTGSAIDHISTNTTLAHGKIASIQITYNKPLLSGTYTIELASDRGGRFVSPSFTIHS
jgi:hypothetical protein